MVHKINIVSFNIPYPADYGGVIDVFYKIKSLHKIGVDIILHTFEYGREHTRELNKYCREVHYYKRNTGIYSQFSFLPYIVKSRKNRTLLKNLQENDYPILFEGLHTCYYLNHPSLKKRIKLLRAHNIEHEYYKGLMQSSESLWKKIFFCVESVRLKKLEKKLKHADFVLPLSDKEDTYFGKLFGRDKVKLIPIFHQNEYICIQEKIKEPYLFFHGDLSVPENIRSSYYLIETVAKRNNNLKLLIAGKNPPSSLIKKVEETENTFIVPNPDHEKMFSLIQNASINILYVEHAAGVKLKLLASLYNGRFCLANEAMVEGSMLRELCIMMPENEDELMKVILKYYNSDFDSHEIKKRKETLDLLYDNEENARKIARVLDSPQ